MSKYLPMIIVGAIILALSVFYVLYSFFAKNMSNRSINKKAAILLLIIGLVLLITGIELDKKEVKDIQGNLIQDAQQYSQQLQFDYATPNATQNAIFLQEARKNQLEQLQQLQKLQQLKL